MFDFSALRISGIRTVVIAEDVNGPINLKLIFPSPVMINVSGTPYTPKSMAIRPAGSTPIL